MQEHFNENYMESHKYPNSVFKGKVLEINAVNIAKDGIYKVVVDGELTIKNVTRKVKETGTIEVKGGRLIVKSNFVIALADYDVKIPKAVIKNIAENVQIFVDANLTQITK